ncbi:hypothetical protein Taro_005290 [Colocasia esculenta]|uniref:Uncharacterized protein n=1 Tax=Colocasia esculenta TaxID=4460 RepID=A0A843TMN5_COLES|nr:hypothetical protein [Colocasia esculenta]
MPKSKEEKADDKQISTILFKHAHVIYIYDIYIYAFNGVLYLHWACIQQVMYMDVDDGVFVPPSDVYMVEYICVTNGEFVPPQGNSPLRVSFVTPEDLDRGLDVCHFMTPEVLTWPRCVSLYDTGGFTHVPRRVSFYDTGGLKHGPRESCNNLWRLYAGEHRRARPRRQSANGCRRPFPTRAAYASSVYLWARKRLVGRIARSAMGVCPPIYRICGGHTGGGTLPGGGLAGTSVEAGREPARVLEMGADWRRGPPVRGLIGGPPGWWRGVHRSGVLTGAPVAGGGGRTGALLLAGAEPAAPLLAWGPNRHPLLAGTEPAAPPCRRRGDPGAPPLQARGGLTGSPWRGGGRTGGLSCRRRGPNRRPPVGEGANRHPCGGREPAAPLTGEGANRRPPWGFLFGPLLFKVGPSSFQAIVLRTSREKTRERALRASRAWFVG